jgi:hypothetical protein
LYFSGVAYFNSTSALHFLGPSSVGPDIRDDEGRERGEGRRGGWCEMMRVGQAI